MSIFGSSGFVICNENTISSLRAYASMGVSLLKVYDKVINSYVLDHFIHNSWCELPLLWQNIMSEWEPIDIGHFLDSGHKYTEKVLPLSLLAFRATVISLSLPRQPINSSQPIASFLQNGVNVQEMPFANFSWTKSEKHHQMNSSGCLRARNVKLKKQHEIDRLAEVTNLVLQKKNINHVIDIGSGQGHLSRLLCFTYGLKVATLETVSSYNSAAKNYDEKSLNVLDSKKKRSSAVICGNDDSVNVPFHYEGFLSQTSSKEQLSKILHEAWFKDTGDSSKVPISLLGLHTCGDLAVALLKSFSETQQAEILISVGCCYMKLNQNIETSPCCQGYPLSKFVRELSHSELSYIARELSCHAIEGYVQRLKDNASSLKIHCYRAVLEKIIVNHYPESKHIGLRSVKNYENLSFFEYAISALKRCLLNIPESALKSPENEALLREWKKVVIFYSIRVFTAPVIESLILIDRMLYLFENGINLTFDI